MTAEEINGEFMLLNKAIRHFAPRELVAEFDHRAALPKPQPPRKRKGVSDGLAQLAHTTELMRHQNFIDEPWEDATRYLFALIFHNRLEAWGVMRAPEERIRHERIPSEFFDNPSTGWFRANVIKKRRYCYESVVVKIPTVQQAISHSPTVHNRGQAPQLPTPATEDGRSATKCAPKPGGRPKLVGLVADIIEELEAQHAFDGKIKKERDDLIGRTARSRHPREFSKETHPSPNTIDKAWREIREKNSKKQQT